LIVIYNAAASLLFHHSQLDNVGKFANITVKRLLIIDVNHLTL